MLIYTPGPTEVPPRVLRRMARPITNPDLDPAFARSYESTQEKLKRLMKTKNDVLIMSGEGLLGLEAAVASLVEKGQKVLTIANGVFGEGFVDLVKMYGGVPTSVRSPYDRPVDPESVAAALDADREIRVATFVHCETPSGVLNPLGEVASACRKRGVLLIADAVSSLGGTPVETDSWGIDICLGGSQKCLSAPPGLALVSVSERAWDVVRRRGASIPSYYASLWQWEEWWNRRRLFPYTPSVSDIGALDEALDIALKEGLPRAFERHKRISKMVLSGCRDMGLVPYPKSDAYHSPTVTALRRPTRIPETGLLRRMEEGYGVMIAGSWGKLAGRVLRLGNMGYNARPRKAKAALLALEGALKDLGFVSGGRSAQV
ncbi:MAG: alanine--glyoxylate aminotransferase family protein [Nitrososphaerota archaeon]|nr:alanine--glyoxylate aminotransferase family protein [Nitrososphaerota archaeon]MDG7013329.1 alanine--glyoxylate aminotransferase family protein [Nitrososphaerota archaeon]MDG7025599.1 alanine--glyoxylate aminotransferase family protein [Nitrososphaerota archaeon]